MSNWKYWRVIWYYVPRISLEDDDTDATEVIEELQEFAETGDNKSVLQRLSMAIGEYDFDQALAELDTLESICKED